MVLRVTTSAPLQLLGFFLPTLECKALFGTRWIFLRKQRDSPSSSSVTVCLSKSRFLFLQLGATKSRNHDRFPELPPGSSRVLALPQSVQGEYQPCCFAGVKALIKYHDCVLGYCSTFDIEVLDADISFSNFSMVQCFYLQVCFSGIDRFT